MILYKHQIEGSSWLSQRTRALLLDEQGLGKTITAITAMKKVVKSGKVLVIVPSVVLWNWHRELSVWASDRKVQVVSRSSDSIDESADIVVTTHSLIFRLQLLRQLITHRWALCIVDEIHCFRNPKAKRTIALYGKQPTTSMRMIPPRGSCIVNKCDRVWGLTGTPMPNNVSELWTPLWGLSPDRLIDEQGKFITAFRFRTRYCLMRETPWGMKVVGNRNMPELKTRMKDLTLRRTKAGTIDLPEMRFETMTLRPKVLPAEVIKLSSMVTQELSASEGLAAIKSSEEFSRWRRLSGLAKVPPAAELIANELEDGAISKIVVFAHHQGVIDGLYTRLLQFGAETITGSTPMKERTKIVDRFQNDEFCRVIICNIVAGGVGVTLTAASEAVFVELSPVPGENAQAADRIHRIGQDNKCRVRFISLAGTVDETIVGILRNKTKMIREALA
jgi:SNF2 family DNA or RNA helicase